MNQKQKSSIWPFVAGLLLLAAPAALHAQYEITTNADGVSAIITGYAGSGGKVAIPTNINGLTVTNIGQGAFQSLNNLTSVTIPGSVTNIGAGAFAGCDGLTNVTIPGSVLSISDHAFETCFSLTNVTISGSLTNIGEEAFADSGLISITIPANVTNIGEYAFGFNSS